MSKQDSKNQQKFMSFMFRGEKMNWLDINPKCINKILITHQDTDHVGAIKIDSDNLFKEEKFSHPA